jgi:serine kinase of HPr protein (carbohydrate metabolism regulator)
MSEPSTVHASAVLVGEAGILIRGVSGSGKSGLAFALLEGVRGARLVADDRVALASVNGRLLAAPPPSLAGLMEVRGEGIVQRPYLSPVVIRLVVDLLPAEKCPRLPEDGERTVRMEGIALPRLIVPIGAPDGVLRIAAALRGSATNPRRLLRTPE